MCFSMPFLTTPSAPMPTGTVIVFNPHIFVISISRCLYLGNFSATFTIVNINIIIIIIIIIVIRNRCFISQTNKKMVYGQNYTTIIKFLYSYYLYPPALLQ